MDNTKKENTLKNNFNVEGYRRYNPDISDQSNEWLKKHYFEYGNKENRVWKVNLPKDFNLEVYKLANPDLRELSDGCLEKHFVEYGMYENRIYKDAFFDERYFIRRNRIENYQGYISYANDIRQSKSPQLDFYIKNFPFVKTNYILVNHNSTNNGAVRSLYTLFNFLKSKNKRVLLLEFDSNDQLLKNFNISKREILSYHRDSFLLYWLCQKIRCEKIIFNSINFAMSQVIKWIDCNKLLLFSRETKENYFEFSSYEPNVVLTQKISNTYQNKPLTQPPIIDIEDLKKLEIKEETIIPNFNNSQITIGMCGIIGERKNPKLFLEVAEKLPNYNFMWIGGENLITNLPNVYHIKDTLNVGKYFQLLDYFVLFSENEPFGKVVIENLYLGNEVLTFRDNIFYDHKCKQLEKMYHEYPGSITKDTAIQHIIKHCIKKKSFSKTNKGRQYVLENFTQYNKDFLKLLNLQ